MIAPLSDLPVCSLLNDVVDDEPYRLEEGATDDSRSARSEDGATIGADCSTGHPSCCTSDLDNNLSHAPLGRPNVLKKKAKKHQKQEDDVVLCNSDCSGSSSSQECSSNAGALDHLEESSPGCGAVGGGMVGGGKSCSGPQLSVKVSGKVLCDLCEQRLAREGRLCPGGSR